MFMREGQKYKPKQSTKFPDILKQIGVPSPMSPADNDKIQDWTKLPHIIRAELAALSKFHFQTEEEHKNLSPLLCGILWRILGKKKIFSGSSESVTKEKPLNFTRLRNCVFHNIFSIVFSSNEKKVAMHPSLCLISSGSKWIQENLRHIYLYLDVWPCKPLLESGE